jgi:hypothetical protein
MNLDTSDVIIYYVSIIGLKCILDTQNSNLEKLSSQIFTRQALYCSEIFSQ